MARRAGLPGQPAHARRCLIPCARVSDLTATRTGEAIGARWDEIDLQAKLWTVPGARMKSGREHQVPLRGHAIELLRALPRHKDNPFVFAGARRGAAKQQGYAAGGGSRRNWRDPARVPLVFRDWAAECTGFAREVAEAALAHRIPDAVERSYLRGSFMQKRARLMDEWARFCTEQPAADNVTPLRRLEPGA